MPGTALGPGAWWRTKQGWSRCCWRGWGTCVRQKDRSTCVIPGGGRAVFMVHGAWKAKRCPCEKETGACGSTLCHHGHPCCSVLSMSRAELCVGAFRKSTELIDKLVSVPHTWTPLSSFVVMCVSSRAVGRARVCGLSRLVPAITAGAGALVLALLQSWSPKNPALWPPLLSLGLRRRTLPGEGLWLSLALQDGISSRILSQSFGLSVLCTQWPCWR